MLTNLESKINAVISKSFKANSESDFFIKFQKKNDKLTPTEKVKFLIWSIPAIITCPYATELCKANCYATKGCHTFNSTKQSHARNHEITLAPDFVERVILSLIAYGNTPSYKQASKIVVRVHESGDFYSKAYMDAWFKIASAMQGDDRFQFVAYTKSIAYIDSAESIPANFTIRFSIWDDTNESDIERARELGLPTYSAVDTFTNETARERCECVSCATCYKCFNAKFESLLCEIH